MEEYPTHSNQRRSVWRRYAWHLILLIITVITTTLSGAEWTRVGSFLIEQGAGDFKRLGWQDFLAGLHYSIPFLGILFTHEMGHYITARRYGVPVSLPYFIPMWFFDLLPTIGTMGAFIRIEGVLKDTRQLFDVGIAGPLAGFVVALGVIFYGFTHLPPPEYILEIHPSYVPYGLDYAKQVYDQIPEGQRIFMGTNLLFELCKWLLVEDPALLPNGYEIMHYPYLFAGFLACFFTALNLLPIGQLDGGHVLYAMIGPRHFRWLSPTLFCVFLFAAGLGIFSYEDTWQTLLTTGLLYVGFLYFALERNFEQKLTAVVLAMSIFTTQFVVKSFWPSASGFGGWLLFGIVLGRFLGIHHPPPLIIRPLNPARHLLGWLALLIFILCFAPAPIEIR